MKNKPQYLILENVDRLLKTAISKGRLKVSNKVTFVVKESIYKTIPKARKKFLKVSMFNVHH